MNMESSGAPVRAESLLDLSRFEREYFQRALDLEDPTQIVSFGTSGHRGTPLKGSFNEPHVLAVVQAVCEYRRHHGINGPLLLGKDTHAASALAERTTIEVLAGNGVETWVQANNGFTPTPVISHAILVYNRGRATGLADGLVITSSHNPPADGGIKYNTPKGGPSETAVTQWIQKRANEVLKDGNRHVQRTAFEAAIKAPTTRPYDFALPYLQDLPSILDLEAIRAAGLRIGIDPMGGAAVGYWHRLAELYHLNLTVVNERIDPTFSFMPPDHDGKIRMDCSSPYAMAGLVKLKDSFDIAFGNDPDVDRHGIVTRGVGLMNPNHYLAAAIRYLLTHRPQWPATAAVGKTAVTSSIIDRLVGATKRSVTEVPVGFKWFAPLLFERSCCFGGEESAGASFLRRDGTTWTTDKDGIILGLLAAEMTAVTGENPAVHYQKITAEFGTPYYKRIDAPATPEQKAKLEKLSPAAVSATELAGEPITAKITHLPGNLPLGGLKVVTPNGWFAARPSGTENLYKLYAESFRDPHHLDALIEEAKQLVSRSLGSI